MIFRRRALEILVKQHAEMSLFVKHIADKQTIPCNNSLFFSDAKVDIAMPSPCPAVRRLPTQSRSRHFGGVSEKKTRSDHVTRKALAARNNEAYGQGNGRQSFCTHFSILLF